MNRSTCEYWLRPIGRDFAVLDAIFLQIGMEFVSVKRWTSITKKFHWKSVNAKYFQHLCISDRRRNWSDDIYFWKPRMFKVYKNPPWITCHGLNGIAVILNGSTVLEVFAAWYCTQQAISVLIWRSILRHLTFVRSKALVFTIPWCWEWTIFKVGILNLLATTSRLPRKTSPFSETVLTVSIRCGSASSLGALIAFSCAE